MKRHYFTFKRKVSIVLLITMLLSLSGFDRVIPYLNSTANAAVTTSQSNQGHIKLKELTDKRTEYSQTYLNTDGTQTVQLYTSPVFYKDESGTFNRIDNSLVATTDSTLKSLYPFENKANKYKIHFAQNSGGSSLYKFSYGRYSVDIAPAECQKADGIYKNNVMLYSDVYDGIDLEYLPSTTGYKENIVINKYTGKNTFDFEVNLKNLVPVPSENGTILLNDSETGEMISVFTTPFMDDAAGETSGDVTQQIIKSNGNDKYILRITASKEWLESSERVYPVKIDPTATSSTVNDTFIYSAYPSYSYYNNHDLRVGYASSVGRARSYVKFTNLPSIDGYITDAKFYAYCTYATTTTGANIELHEIITDWTAENTHWSNQPRFNDIISSTVSNITSTGYYNWSVTDLVRAWYCGRTNYGLMLKDDTENDRYRIFNSTDAGSNVPYLEITSTTLSAPAASVVGGAANSSQGYVNLSWPAVSGAAGYYAIIYNGYEYQYYNADSSTSWTSNGKGIFPTSAQLAAGQWQFRTDGTGGQLSDDPRTLYNNAYNAHSSYAGQFSDYRGILFYALRYIPYRTFNMSTVDGSYSSTQSYTYSRWSEASTPTLPDRTAPPAPSLASITGTNGASGSGDAATVTAAWNASTDSTTGSNSGVASYSVNMYKTAAGSNPYSAAAYNTATTTGTSYTLSGQSDYSAYGFAVRAVDKNGNYSPYASSSSLTWTAADTTSPAGPTTISVNPATWARSITLNWSGASDGESGLSDMQYKVDSGTWTSLGSSAASGNKVLTGLAAGQHTLYVRAKDAAGNYTASPNSLTYYYDSTVPFVQITGPSTGSYVSGTINITGSATDTYFKNYVVEYSRQSEDSWTAIGTTQTAQVTNGTLAALNTAALADGVYKIRLTASDNAGSTSVTVQNITIDNTTESSNASITAPVASALADGTVDIWGTAFETNFSSAKLEYGASSSPASWTTIATLSSAATTDSYLASWNTSSLSAGVYTIRLTVTDKTNHTVTKTVQVTIPSRTVIDNLGTSGYNPTADLALGSVNTVNGNFSLGVTDLSVAQGKGPAINVSRTYNSLNKTCGLFGWGWTLSIPTLTVNNDNSVDIVTGDGYKVHFVYSSTTGAYTEASGGCSAPLSYAALTCDSSTGIYTLAYKDDSKTLFDNTNGKVYEKDSLGNTLTYTITPGTITITDAVSRTVTLNIDTTYKHITSMTDFNVTGQGTRTWTYGYDKYGNLAVVTAPGNKVTTYAYSPDTHNLLSIATPNEAAALAGDSSYTVKKHVYTYSGYKLVTATDKLGIVTNVAYDTANNLTTVTGYYGLTEPKVLKYYYDSYGRLAKLTDALKDTIYTYGDSVNPYLSTKVEKKSGVNSLESESYTYDSNGNTLTYTDKDSLTTTYTYTDNHVATVTDPKGTTVTYSYDTSNGTYNLLSDSENSYDYYDLGTNENGALKTLTDKYGVITTYEYTNGYVSEVNDKNSNNITLNKYDESGRVTETTSANKTIKYEYYSDNTISKVTEVVGSDSKVTQYSYDNEKNLVKEISPDNIVTEYYYNSAGQLINTSVKDGKQSTILNNSTDYISSQGTLAIADSEGNTIKFDYDNESENLDTFTDAKDNERVFSYDNLNRITSVQGTVTLDQLSVATQNYYTYDNNNLKSIKQNNFSYIFNYDEYGRNIEIKIGDSDLNEKLSLVIKNYKANTNLIQSIAYANNQNLSFEYDEKERITKKQYNNITKFEYQYTDQQLKIIDSLNNITYTITFDINDRVKNITDSLGNYIEYVYKTESIIDSVTTKIDGVIKTTSYVYEDNDRLSKAITSSGKEIAFSYDSIKRAQSKTIPISSGNYTVGYNYKDNTNGTTTSNLKSINNNGSIIEYSYDKNGNITSIISDGKQITYKYNELNELIREDNQVINKTIVYSYDINGNILSKEEYSYTSNEQLGSTIQTIVYAYDDTYWKDKLTTFNQKQISYDEIGNPINYDEYTFSWEMGKQLSSITGNDKNISYKYNDLGLRTEKTVNGVTTKYYLNGELTIYEETGTDKIYYTYDSNGKLLSFELNDVEYYYIRNGQGDILGLIDNTGTQVVTYTYDIWGKLISIEGALKDTVGAKNPFRYRGYMYDTETGLYYLKNRYYNPEWGRFLNADENLGNPGELLTSNVFAYCGNNPVTRIDPNGHTPADAVDILMGTIDGVLQSVSYGGFKSFYTPKDASKYYGGKIYGNVSVAILSTIYTIEASAGAVITSPTGVGAVAFSAAAAYTASIAVSASACAAKNTIIYSQSKGAGKTANIKFPKSNNDMKKIFGVNDKVFHKKVKPEILKQIKKDPYYSKQFKKMGSNPDIGVDGAGNIVLKDVRTGKLLTTNWSFKRFIP